MTPDEIQAQRMVWILEGNPKAHMWEWCEQEGVPVSIDSGLIDYLIVGPLPWKPVK